MLCRYPSTSLPTKSCNNGIDPVGLLLPLVGWHRSEFVAPPVCQDSSTWDRKNREFYLAPLALALLDTWGGMEICAPRRQIGASGESPLDVSPARAHFWRHRVFESPLDAQTSIGIPHNRPLKPPSQTCHTSLTNSRPSSRNLRGLRARCCLWVHEQAFECERFVTGII